MKNLIMVLAFGMAAMGAWAQCVPGQPMENVATGYQQLQSYGLGTNVLTKFWEVGNAQGANSGTLASSSMAEDYGGGAYYVYTNWGLSGVVGCPAPSGRTAFLYSVANGGAAKFLVMSVAQSGGFWNFDAITNGPGNMPTAISIPTPHVSDSFSAFSARSEVVRTVTWAYLTSAQLKGYYDTDQGKNVVTGYAIRYKMGTSYPPPSTDYHTSAWALAGVVTIGPNGSDPGYAYMNFPNMPSSDGYCRVSLSVLFDGQSPGTTGASLGETDFVAVGNYTRSAGEVEGLQWTNGKTRLEWTAWGPGIDGGPGYQVARGKPSDLSHLLDWEIDSCHIGGYYYAYVDDLNVPCPGDFFWYLVKGSTSMYCPWCGIEYDGHYDGTWGYATDGERVVNLSGDCATPDPCP